MRENSAAAGALSQRDGELCCDEATVQRLGESERASYGRTLLAITCQGRDNPLLAATSITGSGIKERIRLLAKRPKMAAYTLAAVVLIAATAVGCTFTGAKSGNAISSDPGEDLTVLSPTSSLDASWAWILLFYPLSFICWVYICRKIMLNRGRIW